MRKDEIEKTISILKKNKKRDSSQIRLIFKTNDLGHKIKIIYRRQKKKSHSKILNNSNIEG